MIELRGDRPRRWTPLAIGVVLLLAAACGTSGRSMQAPAPGATAPPRRPDPTTSSVVAGQSSASTSNLFTLSSSAFEPGGEIPAEFTCDNAGNVPPLQWANVPAGTVELALVITDPDAKGYVHWIVTKIDPTTTGLSRFAPQGAVEITNSRGTTAYAPLCPPPGETHQYDFTLYALEKPSGLTADAEMDAAFTTLATSAIGTSVLTGHYTRNTAN